jgi:hypothetical protein
MGAGGVSVMNARAALYEPKLAERILDQMLDGRTLSDICRDPGMPDSRTVRTWIRMDCEGFARRFLQARDIGATAMAEQIMDIADDGSHDWIEQRKKNGDVVAVVDHEHIARSRLRCDVRRWLLSKLLPKVYGSRPEPDAGQPKEDRLARLLKQIDGRTRGLPRDDPPRLARADPPKDEPE